MLGKNPSHGKTNAPYTPSPFNALPPPTLPPPPQALVDWYSTGPQDPQASIPEWNKTYPNSYNGDWPKAKDQGYMRQWYTDEPWYRMMEDLPPQVNPSPLHPPQGNGQLAPYPFRAPFAAPVEGQHWYSDPYSPYVPLNQAPKDFSDDPLRSERYYGPPPRQPFDGSGLEGTPNYPPGSVFGPHEFGPDIITLPVQIAGMIAKALPQQPDIAKAVHDFLGNYLGPRTGAVAGNPAAPPASLPTDGPLAQVGGWINQQAGNLGAALNKDDYSIWNSITGQNLTDPDPNAINLFGVPGGSQAPSGASGAVAPGSVNWNQVRQMASVLPGAFPFSMIPEIMQSAQSAADAFKQNPSWYGSQGASSGYQGNVQVPSLALQPFQMPYPNTGNTSYDVSIKTPHGAYDNDLKEIARQPRSVMGAGQTTPPSLTQLQQQQQQQSQTSPNAPAGPTYNTPSWLSASPQAQTGQMPKPQAPITSTNPAQTNNAGSNTPSTAKGSGEYPWLPKDTNKNTGGNTGDNGSASNVDNGGTKAPSMSKLEKYVKDTIDANLGPGRYDRLKQTWGDVLDHYSSPDHKFWDEPDTPEGAISAAIREGQFHDRALAEWHKQHGSYDPPQEQWDKWYYMARAENSHDRNYDHQGYYLGVH